MYSTQQLFFTRQGLTNATGKVCVHVNPRVMANIIAQTGSNNQSAEINSQICPKVRYYTLMHSHTHINTKSYKNVSSQYLLMINIQTHNSTRN